MNFLINTREFLYILTIYLFFNQSVFADTQVTIRTPEGCTVTVYTISNGTPDFTDALAQDKIDFYGLDAEIIESATAFYNCHGYAWAKSENMGTYWIGYNSYDNEELKYFNDSAYSNDGQSSYIVLSGQDTVNATHGCYQPYWFSDHSIRVIQNGYPVASSGSRTHVSKWSDGPLVRHAPRNDIFAVYFEIEAEFPVPIEYSILKTTHSGTLSNNPKTWIGAGNKNHIITDNVNGPSGYEWEIKSGATVQFISGKNMTIPYGLTTEVSLTIPSTSTLTINSGADIEFTSNKSLIINGTLNASSATFTRSGASGMWYGIEFNNGSGGSLYNCTIEYAHYGVYCNQSLPNITYCTISDNYTGIELYNTGVRTNNIGNNTIEDNQYYGIYMSYSSPRNIYGNTIQNNGQAGIYCASYCTPYIYNNTITNNGAAGITFAVFSPGHLGSYSAGPGYNLITGNYWGVGCGYESDAILGTTSTGGYNSINSNTSYEVLSEYDSEVMAENNWWNRTPPSYPNYYYSGDFSTSYGGTLDYIPALTSNPLGALLKMSDDNIENTGAYQSGISLLPEVSNSNSFFDFELRDALNDLLNGNYEEAINKYAKRLKEERDKNKKKYILRRIAECYNLSEKKGFADFLNYEVRQNLSRNDEIYATTLFLENMFLIRENKYEQAIANFNTLKNDFPKNEAIVKPALFNLVCLNYKQLDNSNKAKDYLNELKSQFPNDDLTRQAMLLSGEIENIFAPEIKKDAITEIKTPDNFSLLGNYPNPFNPTTEINFSVPVTSNVKLTIYNMMGQEIKYFESNGISEGNHNFTWNGTNKNNEQVASGIYIYRISAVGHDGQVFEKSAKMMLIK